MVYGMGLRVWHHIWTICRVLNRNYKPESVVTNDESRSRTERDRGATVRDDAPDVVGQGLASDLALTRKFYPEDRVFRGVDGTAVHLDGAADSGNNGRTERIKLVWNKVSHRFWSIGMTYFQILFKTHKTS